MAIVPHTPDDGLAISRSGQRAAVALYGRPSNEILLIDTSSGAISTLTTEDPSLRLVDPSFDPTGRKLVLVARPPTYWGIGKVIIVDLESGAWSGFEDANRNYARPTYSPDGKRLAYFRDVNIPRSVPGHLQPHLRQSLAWAVFERELDTGVEKLVDPQVFGAPYALFYSADDNGLYVGARAPMVRSKFDSSHGLGEGIWEPSPEDTEISQATANNGILFKRWDGPPLDFRTPIVPSNIAEGANLGGVCADGRILMLRGVLIDQSRGEYQNVGLLYDGKKIVQSVTPPGSGAQHLACSFDGQSFIGVQEPGPGQPTSKTKLLVSTGRSSEFRIVPVSVQDDHSIILRGIDFNER